MVVNGIDTPIAIFIAPLSDSGWSKLDVVPEGGRSAGVGVAMLVVVAIFQSWVKPRTYLGSWFGYGFSEEHSKELRGTADQS